MSHSSIFQLSESEIPKDDFADESDFYTDDALYTFADYINNMSPDERDMSIEELRGCAAGAYDVTRESDAGKTKITDRLIITDSGKTPIDADCYVYLKDRGFVRLDAFVRQQADGSAYFIGAVLGYHY